MTNKVTQLNLGSQKKCPIMVREHHLELSADPFRMKLIAEAISAYVERHQLEDDITLNDFRYRMESAYQLFHNLHQDDWAYIEEDREKVHGAF
tara:strand:+ start:115 stop:393 length:279 start_codon:yes stop_codon:yes gene_type:complete